MKKTDFLLSIIIPVYNEIERINNLKQVVTYFNTQAFSYELIIVNDGSTDQTLSWLKKFNPRLNRNFRGIKIVSYNINKGKGYALKTGMLKASGRYRLFFDIDLSTPLKEFEKFIRFFEHFDLIIASRKQKGAKVLKRQSILRENLGKGFTWLSQQILGVKVSDFTCGFKCFSKEAVVAIFNDLTIDRWGFDSEILFLAKKKNLSVKEIPVAWENDSNSKVKFPQDIIRSLSDLIKIRLNDFKKIYKS